MTSSARVLAWVRFSHSSLVAFEFGVEIRPDGTSGRYIRGALDGGAWFMLRASDWGLACV